MAFSFGLISKFITSCHRFPVILVVFTACSPSPHQSLTTSVPSLVLCQIVLCVSAKLSSVSLSHDWFTCSDPSCSDPLPKASKRVLLVSSSICNTYTCPSSLVYSSSCSSFSPPCPSNFTKYISKSKSWNNSWRLVHGLRSLFTSSCSPHSHQVRRCGVDHGDVWSCHSIGPFH